MEIDNTKNFKDLSRLKSKIILFYSSNNYLYKGEKMGLSFLFEAFKFHKLKSAKTIQVLFLAVFLLNFLFLAYPLGDADFSALINWIADSQMNLQTRDFLLPNPYVEPVISTGNLIYLLSNLVMHFVNLSASYLYATIMLGDYKDHEWHTSLKNFANKTPHLILFTILMYVPYAVGMAFLTIPYYIVLGKVLFSPLLVVEEKHSLPKSLAESWHQTKGVTASVVFSFIMLTFGLNFIESLLLLFMPASALSFTLSTALFEAFSVVIIGRLISLYYIYFVKMNPRGFYRIQENPLEFVKKIRRIRSEVSGEELEEDLKP